MLALCGIAMLRIWSTGPNVTYSVGQNGVLVVCYRFCVFVWCLLVQALCCVAHSYTLCGTCWCRLDVACCVAYSYTLCGACWCWLHVPVIGYMLALFLCYMCGTYSEVEARFAVLVGHL